MTGIAAVILAAGAGIRMGEGEPKAFRLLGGRPLLRWSVELFESLPVITDLVVVCAAGAEDRTRAAAGETRRPLKVVAGGAVRHESEAAGLEALASQIEQGAMALVLVHDAARPFASPALVDRLISVAQQEGAAIPALRAPDTVVQAAGSMIAGYPTGLWSVQTPQAFAARPILEAHRRARREGFSATDTAAVLEWAGGTVRIVESSPDNYKVTTAADLARAQAQLGETGR
jgi:2-C-methyl-D-erythritol 4-phosphate cytidylyltransferase/2-C-methyl-D-erythritol 2,4-cyclodiphosphate synthase